MKRKTLLAISTPVGVLAGLGMLVTNALENGADFATVMLSSVFILINTGSMYANAFFPSPTET